MKNFKTILISLSCAFLLSCGSDSPSLSSAKLITSFTISGIESEINQSSNTISLEIAEADLTALAPAILISENATINPASDIAQNFSNPVNYTVTAEDGSMAIYTVTVSSLITPFSHNGTNYEIVRLNRTWSNAAAFAIGRGGFLAEINNQEEQDAIFQALNNSSIIASSTVAPDGGGASYVWIGGNDLTTEGTWIWDGNNDQTGDQFWMGLQNGSPVNGLYNNWGNEPDNFGSGQDALGLAITNWPLGVAGQWNDVQDTNELYFVVELN